MKTHLGEYKTAIIEGVLKFKFSKYRSICGEKSYDATARKSDGNKKTNKSSLFIKDIRGFKNDLEKLDINECCVKCHSEYKKFMKLYAKSK